MNASVLSVAHLDNEKHIKYVWWYDKYSQSLEGSELTDKIRRHANFKKPDDNDPRWVKGRLIEFCNENYLMVHTNGYGPHAVSIVSNIASLVGKKFSVDYVINESAELLQT